MTTVTPVVFTNRNKLKLYGFVHEPSVENKNDICIVLLSPGVKTRVAPHRLYVKMAKCFVGMGFTVFRFDYNGLGDAEGVVNEELLADFYNSVALGRYIEDTRCSIDWFEKNYGINRFIYSGLCGGALTGLLSGCEDARVVGLLALGIPCVLEQSENDPIKNITKGQLKQLKSGYVSKLLNPKSWLRLLTFRSDFRILFRSLTDSLFSQKSLSIAKDSVIPAPSVSETTNLNPLFLPAFFKMAKSSKKMLLIFSGADRLEWEFKEKFFDPNEYELKRLPSVYEVHTVQNANHVFSNSEWQQEMLSFAGSWLKKYFIP